MSSAICAFVYSCVGFSLLLTAWSLCLLGNRDMMEIGNQGDFKSDRGMILTHFTYWVMIKANLLLSTLLDELPTEILKIVTNKEALA